MDVYSLKYSQNEEISDESSSQRTTASRFIDESTAVAQVSAKTLSLVLVSRGYLMRYSK